MLGGHADLAEPAPGRLGVVHDRVARRHHAMAGGVHPPAEVEVVAEDAVLDVEAAEPVPHVAADQHPGAADGEHVADAVVLALVELAAVQAGLAAPGGVDGEAELAQDAPVVPVADLGAQHRDAGVGVGGPQ